MLNRAQKFWDKQAKRFDDTEKQFEPVYQEIIAKTKEYLQANDTVLDFGCATGTKTLKLCDGIKHIHHLLEDSGEALRRIHELLKPGGLFISTTACFKDKMAFKTRWAFTTCFFMERIGLFPLHLNMFRTSDVEELIRRQNFSIVRNEKIVDRMTVSFIVAKKTE